jgi:hypothetical protein
VPAGPANACYAPEIEAALLRTGYTNNIVTIRGKKVLRATGSDPTDGVWARDLGYALGGYSYVLDELIALRDSIELLLAGVEAGVAPEGYFNSDAGYEPGQVWDSGANLIHAMYVYVAKTGNREFYNKHRETLQRIGGWIVALDQDGDGLPEHRDGFPYGYNNSVTNSVRHTYALAKFYRAFTELAELEAFAGGNGDVWQQRAERLRVSFHRPESGYWLEGQPWPVAWFRADGSAVSVLESFGVFEALRSGLIAPGDAHYQGLVAALHERLPELLRGQVPLRLALEGYPEDVLRKDVPAWKLNASAPWVVGLAAPAYAAAGYAEDARVVLEAYQAAAQAGPLPRLVAAAGTSKEGAGGAWEHAAWFLALYGGHYGLTFTPAALVVQPRPFQQLAGDGIRQFSYQGARLDLALDAGRQVYSIRSDHPAHVILRPMGQAAQIRVDGGPPQAEARLMLEPGHEYIVVSEP